MTVFINKNHLAVRGWLHANSAASHLPVMETKGRKETSSAHTPYCKAAADCVTVTTTARHSPPRCDHLGRHCGNIDLWSETASWTQSTISSSEWDTLGLLLRTDDIIGVSDPGLYIEVCPRQMVSVRPWRIDGTIRAIWYDRPTTPARCSWDYASLWRPHRECVPYISRSAYIGNSLEALWCRCLHVHHFLIMKDLSHIFV